MVKNRVFGGSWQHLLAEYDQTSSCWRTCQLSLFEEAEKYLEALPSSGMMQNGQLYQLNNLEHPIYDEDGFSLPTPTANAAITCSLEAAQKEADRLHPQRRATLWSKIAVMLPTPSASEHKYRLAGDTQASRCLEAMARRGDFGKKARLHPLFVEWMMGFPKEWTEYER